MSIHGPGPGRVSEASCCPPTPAGGRDESRLAAGQVRPGGGPGVAREAWPNLEGQGHGSPSQPASERPEALARPVNASRGRPGRGE